MGRPGRGFKAQFTKLFKVVLLCLPVAIFVLTHNEQVGKAWKAIASEKIIDGLALPLRAAALLCANTPSFPTGETEERTSGTPPFFAAFQVASLFGVISVELMVGSRDGVVAAVGDP